MKAGTLIGVFVSLVIIIFISGCYQNETGHVYGVIQINGSALSRNFSRYYIEYGSGWNSTNWSDYGVNLTNNGTSQVNESVLGTWDTIPVSDGNYTIRLSVVDADNTTSQDFLYVVVDNVFISSPEDNSTVYMNRTINITGGAAGANFQSYALEYSPSQLPYNWSSEGITLANNGTEPVGNDILGFWNMTNLTGGPYILRLTVNGTDGQMDEANITINVGIECMRITENTTLDSNLTGYGACIIIEANNVLLDCTGHHLVGGQIYGQYAISLNHTSSVTVRNCVIEDYWCNDYWECDSEQYSYGIYAYNSSNITLTNNTVSNNYFGIYMDSSGNSNLTNNIVNNSDGAGIYLYDSGNSTLTNNAVSNNRLGIILDISNNSILTNNTANNYVDIYFISSAFNTLANNTMENGGVYIYGLKVSYFTTHSIDTSNTVNGKPIRYLKNTGDMTVPSGVGQVILANVTNVTVDNLNISNTSNGILVAYSSGCTIRNNNASNNYYNGIELYTSDDNVLINNTAEYNNYSGIALKRQSNNNVLINNTADEYNYYGISLSVYSNYNTLTGNTAGVNWYYGIYLSSSSSNNLTDNNASNNRYYGIYLTGSSNSNTIANNTASNNANKGIFLASSDNNNLAFNTANNNAGYGINIGSSDGNNITSNTANNNDDGGIWLDSSNNNTVENNTVSNNTYGIRVRLSSSILPSNYNTIANNTASNNNYGIYFTSSTNNTLISNTLVNNNDSGIFLESSSNYNTLTSNTACNNTNYDIHIANDSDDNSGGNTCDTMQDCCSNDVACMWDCLGNPNCGASLTEDTTLGENLTCNGNALSIGSSDITLDCNGHTLTGNTTGHGINVTNQDNVTIENCVVLNFTQGISLTSSNNCTLSNNTASSNTGDGIYLESSDYNTIANNTASSNTGDGIYMSSSSNNTVAGNTALNNTDGIYLSSSSNYNTLSGNTLSNNTDGIYMTESHHNNITNNTASSNNRYGIHLCCLDGSTNNTLTNNIVKYNQRHGIYFSMNTNTGNTMNNNQFCLNNQSGGAYYDVYDADSNSGDDNYCDTVYNYNDAGATGCSYLCSVARLNATINCSVNGTVRINSSSVNVSLELMMNTCVNNTNVILRRYNTSTRSASLSVPSIGKYISIDADEQLSNSLEFVLLRIFFTEEELTSSGLNETDFGMWWYNSSLDAWQMLNADTMGWVYGTGTNTTEYYVWGNLSHFSDYTIAQGSETQSIPLITGWNLISIPLVV